MLLLALTLCASIASGIVPETPTAVDVNFNATLEMNLSHEQTTLTDMFTEVKEQMEDTQHKLQDAVHEMDSENAKSSRYVQNLTANYYSESDSQTVAGNQSIPTAGTIDKVPDNTTEESNIKTTDQSNGNENEIDRTCSKDEECSAGELCVWGQCAKNVTKGDAGTICKFQRDCNSDLCCAVHKAFPVCSSKPMEHERCVLSANHLLELLSWDMEGVGTKEHCPCAADLQCQHLGRGSLCLKGQSSSEEELTDSLYSEIDYIV